MELRKTAGPWARGGVAQNRSGDLCVTNCRVPEVKIARSNTLCWRRPTLALRLPSAQTGLTAVFGMRTGVPQSPNHQHKIFDFESAISLRDLSKRERVCQKFFPAGKTFRHASPRQAPALRKCTALSHPSDKSPEQNLQFKEHLLLIDTEEQHN